MKKLFIVAVITALLTMTTGCGDDESNNDVATTVTTTTVAVTTEEPTTIEPTEELTTGVELTYAPMCYDPDLPRMTDPLGCFGEPEEDEDEVEDNEPFTGPTIAPYFPTVHPVS